MRELNGAEALMGFLGWLTSRDQPITLSSHHNATLAVELFNQFEAVNDLGNIGPDWPDCYVRPDDGTTTNERDESFKDHLAHREAWYGRPLGKKPATIQLEEHMEVVEE